MQNNYGKVRVAMSYTDVEEHLYFVHLHTCKICNSCSSCNNARTFHDSSAS